MPKVVTFLPDGSTLVEDDRTLDDARAEAVQRIKAQHQAALAEGMPWEGKVLQITPEATANITAVMLQVVAGIPLRPGFAWRMLDDTFLPMDAEGVATMAQAASDRVQALRIAKWAAIDQARAAETIEDADAVAMVVPPAA
jgi:hypothetical protein